MGWKTLVSIIFLAVSINSCCVPLLQKKFYTTEYGSHRPIKSKFKLGKKPYELKKEDNIRIDCIYKSSFTMDGSEKKGYTTFLRFFANGRYLNNVLKTDVSPLDQYNNLKKGGVGYYKVEGNKIILEEFVVGAQDCGKYHIYSLNILNDNIESYEKIKVEGLTGKPNW